MQHSFSSDSDSWSFTIIRSQGLGPLRPEKAWRPIVTVAFDQQHHEIVLGSDGQNPNLKRSFYLSHADPKSLVDIDVWHKSQSKKKARKRNQVASVRLSLGEVLKRQAQERKAEIRLNCHSSTKRGQNRGKQQHAACLHVRLRPPASYSSLSESSMGCAVDDDALSSPFSFESSDTLTSPPTPTDTEFSQPEPLGPIEDQKPPKRRVRGYSVDPNHEESDDEVSIDDDLDFFEEDTLLEKLSDMGCSDGIVEVPHISIGSWLVASLLPRYADQASIESTMSVAETTVSRFSIYQELKDASLDEDYARVLTEMNKEWSYVGGCLIALASLDATIFSATSGGTNVPASSWGFKITELTQQLIAVSSIFTGLGLVIDAWLMLRYGISSAQRFQRNALDVYGTYLSFCVTSRIPIIFTFLSACSLMGFLVIVAASVWPTAAIVLCGLSGVACTLQYLIYGLHSLWCFGFRVLRGIRNATVRGCGWVFGKSTSPVSAGSTSEAVVPSAMTQLPPPAHLSNTIAHAPPRPPRNPARLASVP